MTNSSRPPASQATVPNAAAGGEDTASVSRQRLPAEGHVSGEITPTERQINVDTAPTERQTNVDAPPTERNAGPDSATANPQYPSACFTDDPLPRVDGHFTCSVPLHKKCVAVLHDLLPQCHNHCWCQGADHLALRRSAPLLSLASMTHSLTSPVGDVTVTLNPHQEFPDLPASYCGPLVCACTIPMYPRTAFADLPHWTFAVSGYVLLVPCST